MSAWMVCDKQISVVINQAIQMGIIDKKDAQRIGQTMVNNNVKSLVARYGNREKANKHKFQYDSNLMELTLVQSYKYAKCINYQCCEYNTWKKSSSYKFLKNLCTVIENKLNLNADDLHNSNEWSLANWCYKD